MTQTPFTPFHINATADDLAGNDGIGRYIFLPGSDGRAREIASHFSKVTVKAHPRGHNLYLGTLQFERKKIEVASIASGMGCPSMEIILHELFHLGAKRFLRVGTAGSLQPDYIPIGSLINVQASVRDEDTTVHYAPREFPAIASLEMISAALLAAEKIGLSDKLHTGIVHCKSSFYAREFGAGPLSTENNAYIDLLTRTGTLASEMETSALFIQSHLYNHRLMQEGVDAAHRVLAGAVLGIIAVPPHLTEDSELIPQTIENNVQLAIETIKMLAAQELLG